MAKNSYLERCIEAVAGLRRQDIAAMTKGEYIGDGTLFRVYTLGEISLNNSSVHASLKLPKEARDDQSLIRLGAEIALIDKILERAPRVKDRMPQFMGLLAVDEWENNVAVITEDVTKGLTLPMKPIQADWPEELAQGLGGEYGNYVDHETVEKSLAFEVGGEEKWLDFTPPPFGVAAITDPIYADMNTAYERQEELTVTVAADSPLALSIG